MKSFLLAIAAVQILHCSGVPSTKDALRTSVVKLNEITEITNLCGITKRGITNTYRTGKLSYNVDLTFSVKETVCSKSSRLEFDDPSCQFRPQKIAEGGFCKSHVEYLADKVSDIDVECEGLKTVDSESDSTESNITKIEDKTQSTETSLEEPSNANGDIKGDVSGGDICENPVKRNISGGDFRCRKHVKRIIAGGVFQ
ncbi:secreted phosphoprotein 24-like isoform X3 [Narcine bancroftii]|uniref:secreted phosphoprotein 24-like isoform X3 n=1 Tax=Narcine bancroftii TaxID=1343680 RepID=UPI00383231FB